MTKKVIEQYFKINVSEKNQNPSLKCYKVIKKNDKTIVSSYSLKDIITELKKLEVENNNDMKPVFNSLILGVFTVIFFRIYSEFYL